MVSSVFRILLLSIAIFSQVTYHANAKETIILLFGDSIIAGYGLAAEASVPARLQAILLDKHKEINVVNGGVSGDTTSAGRSRLAWTLDKHHPDLVILALGGNDVLRGMSPNLTKENIFAMLEVLKRLNIPTILTAVRAPSNLGSAYSEQLDAVYTEAAKNYNVPLYPFLLNDTYGKNELMQSDGLHPNAKGAELIAQNLAEYLTDKKYILQ
jgi:acyl-CoA thioesterase I